MTDLDSRAGSAAVALRDLVESIIDDESTTDALAAVMGGIVVRLHDEPLTRHRGRRVAMAMVAAAAAVVALVFVVRDHRAHTPVVPTPTLPSPTTLPATPTPPATTVPATTTTIDEAALGVLPTIGPAFGFSPSPPQVVVLRDGRVFRMLGTLGGPTPMEALEPANGKLDSLGSTLVPRANPAFVELPGSRLLIIGGDMTALAGGCCSAPATKATAEILDLTTGVSRSIGGIPGVDSNPSFVASMLDDGTVLVLFGDATPQRPLSGGGAVVFDPASNTFTSPQPAPLASSVVGLFPMPGGRVLVFSENPTVYDPTTHAFTDLPTVNGSERPTSAVEMLDGRVFSIYGYCTEEQNLDAEGLGDGHQPVQTKLFDPATGLFTNGPSIPHCVTSVALLPSGRLFVAGFWSKSPSRVTANETRVRWSGVLDLSTGATHRTPAPNREYGTAVTLHDGRVLLVAGIGEVWADVYEETRT